MKFAKPNLSVTKCQLKYSKISVYHTPIKLTVIKEADNTKLR